METKALPGFVVDQSLKVTEFLGATGPYVELRPGKPSLTLCGVLLPGLQPQVLAAIEQAANSRRAERRGVQVLVNSELKRVNIEVHREGSPYGGIQYRILLEAMDRPAPGAAETNVQPRRPRSEIGRLQRDLATARETLAATLEEGQQRHHTAQKELTANQKLQAELEVANAELEATNEELRSALVATRESESRLQESEERFARFMENLPGLAWIKDLDGRYVYANEAAEKAFQTPRAKLYGRTDAQVFRPEIAEPFRENDQRAVESETGIQAIETLKQEDGVHQSIVSKFPIRDADGKPVMVGGVAIDITESKKAEEAQAMLAAVVRSTSDAIISTTIEGVITSWNHSAERMYGYAATEVIGQPITIIIPPNKREENRRVRDQLRRGEWPEPSDTVRIARDGRRIDVSLAMSPVHDGLGRLIGVSTVARDITDRRKAEERFRLAVEAAPNAMVMVDAEGRIVLVNAQTEESFGYRREELIGQPIELLVPAQFRARHPQYRNDFFAAPHARSMGAGRDLYGLRKDGSEFPVEIGLNPIRTDEGTWVLSAIVDISERRRAETELRRSEKELSDFFENASVGLHWVGPGGVILRANQTELDMLGYRREEYVGRHIAEFHVTHQVIGDILTRLEQGETLREYPARMRRKDGSTRDVLIDSNALFEEGKFIHSRCLTRDVTELKQAQKAQALLAAMVESSNDAIVGKSLDGIIQSWNPAAQQVFGYTAQEAIGRHISLIIPPDRAAEGEEILGRLRAGQRVDHFESVRLRKDGRTVPVSLTISPIKDEAGHVVGASKIARDITARKQAEEALRESEGRFRTLAESSPALIWVNGLEGCEFVNRAYLDFLGVESVQRFDWAEFLHPSERDDVLSAYLAAFAKREVYALQHRFRRADGEYRWMKTVGLPRLSVRGELQGYIGSTFDITDIKEAEAALRESEARFRNMADNAPVMIWVTEGDGTCSYLSKSWYEFTGQTPETGLGLRWLDAVHPDDRERADQTLFAASKQREAFRLDYRLRRSDGQYGWAMDSAAPRFGPGGEFRGYIGSVLDITDRKQMEEALREGDRRKDEFLAILGHELRNPLAAISTGTTLLQSNPPPDRRGWIEQMLTRQVKQLQRLVDDLLDVSRVTRGKIELRKERISLQELLEASVAAVEDLMTQHRHEISLSTPPQAIHLEVDPARVEQMVVNLLTNATKHTPEGGKISLEAEQADEEVIIRCRDTGVGLSPEMLDTIFEPFVQFGPSSERTGAGLGIGLTLVRQLAELHGGSITASSAGPGKGSEFVLRLPRGTPRAPQILTAAQPPALSPPARRYSRILVVDDNRDVAEGLALFLRDMGHVVFVVHDGETAVSIASQERPDVVLLDISLPGMDGFAVAERVRANPDLKHTMVIAVSGCKVQEPAKAAGVRFDAHIVKPLVHDQLVKWLHTGMTGAKAAKKLRQTLRVLLIEDNRELAQLTAELLRRHGHDVEVAYEGEQGAEKARQFRPQVVVCDLNLPDQSGFEIARRLREDLSPSPPLFVGITADDAAFQEQVDQTPFDVFLSKPLTWNRFRDCIESLREKQDVPFA